MNATTWTVRPVPRPEPSVYSGPVLRPVPRPERGGATTPEVPLVEETPITPENVPLSSLAALPDPEEPKPIIPAVSDEAPQTEAVSPKPVAEAAAEPVAEPAISPEVATETAADVPENTEIASTSDPSPPELAGGPAFFRPLLRPESLAPVKVTAAPPDANVAGVLLTSLRPKLRPRSLVIRAAAVAPKPVAPRPSKNPVPVPKPVAKPKPVPPAAPARPADIVMVGDSITAGGRWSSRFPDVMIVNRGISGDTGLKILARMDGILATQPKTALVMFGINDIYNGVSVERILQRYDQIISILLSRKIKVVIQSTLACSGHVCGEKLDKVYALNAGLAKLAKKRRLKFVDINRGLSDRNGLKRAFSSDGIHLNRDGYATWYAMLRPHIKS